MDSSESMANMTVILDLSRRILPKESTYTEWFNIVALIITNIAYYYSIKYKSALSIIMDVFSIAFRKTPKDTIK